MTAPFLVVIVPTGGAWVDGFSAYSARDAVIAAGAFANAAPHLRIRVYAPASTEAVLRIDEGRWVVPTSQLARAAA